MIMKYRDPTKPNTITQGFYIYQDSHLETCRLFDCSIIKFCHHNSRVQNYFNCFLTPCTLAASPDSLAQSIPTLFLSSSNQPTSCLNMALKAATRKRVVRRTPAKLNKCVCKSSQVSNITTLCMHYAQCSAVYGKQFMSLI